MTGSIDGYDVHKIDRSGQVRSGVTTMNSILVADSVPLARCRQEKRGTHLLVVDASRCHLPRRQE